MDINRKTAYEVLLDIEKNQAYSNLSLNYYIEKNKPAQAAFTRELVYGVLENKILLDFYLDNLVPSGVSKLKKQDLTLLRLGIYQLAFADSVPEYAAVNETVNLARKFARGREGFVNGVLRGFIKKRNEIILPSAEENPREYLRIRYSVSPWIIDLWLEAYGFKKTEEILMSCNRAPELSVRVNEMKTSATELKQMLCDEGFGVEYSQHTQRALLVNGKDVLSSKYYTQGFFHVQDEASIMAADAVGAREGDTVVDVCAAPGGKTFAMAEKMHNTGKITAMDIYPHKLSLIEQQASRDGIDIITTKCHDSTEALKSLCCSADKVLVDVPCSGLGVIRRKPEIKYKGKENLSELIDRQKMILQAAASYLKKGGTLVYSTCTVNHDENHGQIENFIKTNQEFNIIEERQLLPTEGTDGFYYCKMSRI